MKYIFLLLLLKGAQVLANGQPQLQPPYTCTTTTTSCQPGERPPHLDLPSSMPRVSHSPGKRGPKGEKGEPCQSNDGTGNGAISLTQGSQARLVKGNKGERGEKGDSCQCNETRHHELKAEIEEVKAELERVKNLAKTTAGSNSPDNAVAAVTKGTVAFANLPTKCSEVKQTDGVNLENVVLYPFKQYFDITPYPVNCSNGGWIVIQRRTTGVQNFNLARRYYVRGFGKVDGEYWMGLEKLHRLTSQAPYKLRIEIKRKSSPSTVYFLEYGHFYVEDENDYFRLVVGDYDGNAGDYMKPYNGMRFSTYDRDVDTHSSYNCADGYDGGWWYNNCGHGLTGHYKTHYTWGGALVYSAMMIQPRC